MKCFLDKGISRRFGFDGWALKNAGSSAPMWWTTCTTREEVRELKQTLERTEPDLFVKLEVVKVNIEVKEVSHD